MEGYLWLIWVKLAGALWIIGGKLGSSLIFYFVAIEENWRSTKNASRNLYSSGTGCPASNKLSESHENSLQFTYSPIATPS